MSSAAIQLEQQRALLHVGAGLEVDGEDDAGHLALKIGAVHRAQAADRLEPRLPLR